MMNQNHPFHLVTPSPWPIIISFSIFNNLICIISWFHNMMLDDYMMSYPIPMFINSKHFNLYMTMCDGEMSHVNRHTKDVNLCNQSIKNSDNLIYYLSNFLFYFFFLNMFSLIFST